MKRTYVRMLAVITATTTLLFTTSCGNKADAEVANVTETVAEETATEAPTPEHTEIPTPEPTAEPTPEPTEEPVEEFTAEIGMSKVNACFEARNELMVNGSYDVEHHFLHAIETFSAGYAGAVNNLVTADGTSIQEDTDENAYIRIAVAATYFYNYVNNNSGYYNFSDYVTMHTVDEIMALWVDFSADSFTTNTTMMMEAPGVLEYLVSNIDSLGHDEMLIGDACVAESVSGIEVYYEIPLTFNDERCGVSAVFDKDGNLLNLITVRDDGWSNDYYGDSSDELGYY